MTEQDAKQALEDLQVKYNALELTILNARLVPQTDYDALRAQLTAAEAIAELHLCTCEREQVGAPHEVNCVLGRLIAARAQLSATEQQLREAKALISEVEGKLKLTILRGSTGDHFWASLRARMRALTASPAQPKHDLGMFCTICNEGGHSTSWHAPAQPTEGAQ